MSFDRIARLFGIGGEGFNRLFRNGGFTLGAPWVKEVANGVQLTAESA